MCVTKMAFDHDVHSVPVNIICMFRRTIFVPDACGSPFW